MESALGEEFELVHFRSERGRGSRHAGQVRRSREPVVLFATIFPPRGAGAINTRSTRAYCATSRTCWSRRCCAPRVVYQIHGGELPEKFFGGRRAATAFCAGRSASPPGGGVANCELEAYRQFVPQQTGRDHHASNAPRTSTSRPCEQHARRLRLLYIGRIAREKGLYETLQGIASPRAGRRCAAHGRRRRRGGSEAAQSTRSRSASRRA